MKVFSFEEFLASGGDSTLRKFSINSAYQRMAWVYACVNRISTTVTNSTLRFYRGNNNPAVEKPKNDKPITSLSSPVIQLFHPPYPGVITSLKELIRWTFIHLGLEGCVYWIREREGNVPKNIRLIRKGFLRPILADPANPYSLVGWLEIKADGSRKRHSSSDVLPIAYYDPNDVWGGLSPLSAAALSLQAEHSISAWNAAFFKSGMKNPLILQSKRRLSKEKKKEIVADATEFYSGIEGGQGVFLVDEGMEATPIKVETKDVDFIEGKKLNREEILGVFGVPPALVGIFEYANYSNVREQIRIFWENTLIPQLNTIRDLVQVNILDPDFPGIYCDWDYSAVPGLQKDPVELSTAARNLSDIGLPLEVIGDILEEPRLIPNGWKPLPRSSSTPSGPKPGSGTGPSEPGAPQQEPAPDPKPPKPRKPKKDLFGLLIRDFVVAVLTESRTTWLSRNLIHEFWKNSVLDSARVESDEYDSAFCTAIYIFLDRREINALSTFLVDHYPRMRDHLYNRSLQKVDS